MFREAGLRATAVPSALAQVLAGLAAHTAAAGCLPGAPTLLLFGPLAVGAVLLTSWTLPRSPLLRLAAGQLAVHSVLALAACAGGGHGAEPMPGAMTLGHVLALVACRAGLDRAVAGLLHALAELLVVRRPVLSRVPDLRQPVALPEPVALRSARLLSFAPLRGPPGLLLPA